LQPAEIVDIGIEKEKKRREFYDLAAKKFSDEQKLADLFARLRDWEDEHVRRFQELRDSLTMGQYTESYPGETEAYMQALVESELYDMITPERFAELVENEFDALDIGIGFEKDAVLFFSGLALYLDENEREVVNELIKEERQHMLYLFNLKNELKG
ncbi:MAG: hypothetical protein B6D63_07150, partial [Candidatus Latescibacteria bacterium 4484_7]